MNSDSSSTNGDQTQALHIFARNQRVGHYVIVEKIASGGMGEVYLACDTDLNRTVVLKFIAPGLCRDEECRARFRREAQAAARLNHPNIVTIYEVAEYEHRPYIAMERVSGNTLTDLLKQGPIPACQAIEIASQLAEALHEAHSSGVIHRDIKPANILITEQGRVKLADFGLATIPENPQVTRPGAMLGTSGYMSPEQLIGKPTDERSDLFSVGIVLYEMLAGHRPFRGDYQAAVSYSIVHETPSSLTESQPDIPVELEAIVMRLLEKEPARRFESASSLGEALRHLSPDTTTLAPTKFLSGWRQRVTMFAVAIILLFVVLHFSTDSDRSSVRSAEPRIAVLPLENGGTPDNDYFSLGITNEINSRLSRLTGLRVIACNSSWLREQSGRDFGEIGRDLDVEYVLAGTLHRSGGNSDTARLRMNIALIRASDNSYVWSEQYEGSLARVFDLQTQIAGGVTRALQIKVTRGERERLKDEPTSNLTAYELYLEGNMYFNRSWSRGDIMVAIELYQKAVALDSRFAAAFAQLARGHASMYWEYFDRSNARCSLAVAMADRALALDNELAESHLARGYCYYHCDLNYDSAMAEFRRGLALNPNSADLYNAVAAVQRRQGNLIEAAGNFIAAYTLDPRSYLRSFDVALTFGMLRDYPQAFAFLDSTSALIPSWSLPHIYRAWLYVIRDGSVDSARVVLTGATAYSDIYSSQYFWWLARSVSSNYEDLLARTRPGSDSTGYLLHRAQIFDLMGRGQERRRCADSARVLLEDRLRSRPEDPRFNSQLGLAWAYLDNRNLALQYSYKAVQLLPASKEAFDAPFFMLNLAEVLVRFRMYDEATAQLEYLLKRPGFVTVPYLRVDPLWRPLDSTPRFRQLIQTPI